MFKFEKIAIIFFCINIVLGFIAFGYIVNKLFGISVSLLVTAVVYMPIVLLGAKPSLEKKSNF